MYQKQIFESENVDLIEFCKTEWRTEFCKIAKKWQVVLW